MYNVFSFDDVKAYGVYRRLSLLYGAKLVI